jgi:hypothetical protein
MPVSARDWSLADYLFDGMTCETWPKGLHSGLRTIFAHFMFSGLAFAIDPLLFPCIRDVKPAHPLQHVTPDAFPKTDCRFSSIPLRSCEIDMSEDFFRSWATSPLKDKATPRCDLNPQKYNCAFRGPVDVDSR